VTLLSDWLDEERERGAFPGGSVLVGTSREILAAAAAGEAAVEPERQTLTPATLFDLASLTKPLATGALARLALKRGLALEDPPGRYFSEWKKTCFEGITVERLLTHTSGLPAWYPLYTGGEGRSAYRRRLSQIEPESPPGRAVVYSDLGLLLAGDILELLFSSTLDRAFDDLVAAPSGSAARFLPPRVEDCAATERGDRVERRMTAERGLSYAGFADGVVRGEVHDGNARRRGGVAGNAGLFGTAEDVWRLARPWLDPSAREFFASDRTPELPEARGLAWQLRRGAGSAIPEFSEGAFGHTGFTGTSVWIDPERDAIFVLLTNRIHPDAREESFHPVRHRFHRAALRLL
jgi:CubicO group peptidase (beta-lactamase class C family)